MLINFVSNLQWQAFKNTLANAALRAAVRDHSIKIWLYLQVSEVPDLSPLRVVIGTMIVSFVPLAVDLWWARDLSLRLMTSFVQNVLRKNSWQIQLNNKHTLNLTFFLHFSPKTNKCYTNTRLLLAKGVIRFRGIL